MSEFTLDVQIFDDFNPFSFLHGNKHIEEEAKVMIQKEMFGHRLKRSEKIKYWKINIFLSGQSLAYTTCINLRDLEFYFETDIFKFYELNPNMPK